MSWASPPRPVPRTRPTVGFPAHFWRMTPTASWIWSNRAVMGVSVDAAGAGAYGVRPGRFRADGSSSYGVVRSRKAVPPPAPVAAHGRRAGADGVGAVVPGPTPDRTAAPRSVRPTGAAADAPG